MSVSTTPDTTVKAGPTVTGEPSLDAVFGECGPAPTSMATDVYIMATDWGPIYCGLPDDFPVCPRCEPDETFGDPITAVWIASGDAGAVALWYRSALEAEGYRTMSMSSLNARGEAIVIESMGPAPDCRVQTSVYPGPAGEDRPYAYVSVRYGTGCPPP